MVTTSTGISQLQIRLLLPTITITITYVSSKMDKNNPYKFGKDSHVKKYETYFWKI